MDFVFRLSKTQRHVDRVSKIMHFVLCKKTFDASNVANVLCKEIVRLHGIPKSIVSDSDIKFINHLWKEL